MFAWSSRLRARRGGRDQNFNVTRLILQGTGTAQIAEELVISEHTVRQHLKHIFAKADVRSRRDLVAKVFFTHYEGRLRDNERRTVDGKSMRGGPMG